MASDLKTIMREKARSGKRTFSHTAVVAVAHQQVPIDPRAWHLLRCQVKAEGDVFINTVGFGVASASYCWSRVAASTGRITQYLADRQQRRGVSSWLMISTRKQVAIEIAQHSLLFFLFFAPQLVSSCHGAKTAGGVIMKWVGFELLHRTFQLGISERRAAWYIRWTRQVAECSIDQHDLLQRVSWQGHACGRSARLRATCPGSASPRCASASKELGTSCTLREMFLESSRAAIGSMQAPSLFS